MRITECGAAIAVAGLLGLGAGAVAGDMLASKFTYDGVPMCTTEDSSHCVWVATIQGNGEGHSFIAGEMKDPAPDGFPISHELAEYLTGN